MAHACVCNSIDHMTFINTDDISFPLIFTSAIQGQLQEWTGHSHTDLCKFEISRDNQKIISTSFEHLKSCINFKMVKWCWNDFLIISTGFKFPKISLCRSVPSIHVAVIHLRNVHCDDTKSESWSVKVLVSVLPE